MFSTRCTYSATTCCISDTMLEKMHKRCRTRFKYLRRSQNEHGRKGNALNCGKTRCTMGKRVAVWVGPATAAPHVSASKRLAWRFCSPSNFPLATGPIKIPNANM